MQGTIAQLLSIAAHGNEYLKGRLNYDYFPSSSTFKFCKFVKFVDLQSSGTKWHERDFAKDPNDWFKKLKDTGVVQFRVRYISTNNEEISDRMSVGFVGGGGRWLIETVKSGKSDFWEAGWEVGDRDDPEQNIWHVKYGRILKNRNQPEQALPPASEIKEQLKDILKKISEFAYKNNCGNFGQCFERGLKALEEPPASSDKEYTIFPKGYATPEHHQLLNASQRAWVFGGMGSWNDMGFNDSAIHKEYEELSDKLFNLINLALIVASNPFPRPKEPVANEHVGRNKKWWKFWARG
ncbi:hypothetical protein [Gayadomonas joobiniege]|uniref:hypothetical protein n=1 Tax=Gayadomonas joobiniege TaxID=1234606 RepID=UPI00036C3E0A|nr:hypothetical protein [Gayadomonas joobiniege]